jgi:hypothetical protein
VPPRRPLSSQFCGECLLASPLRARHGSPCPHRVGARAGASARWLPPSPLPPACAGHASTACLPRRLPRGLPGCVCPPERLQLLAHEGDGTAASCKDPLPPCHGQRPLIRRCRRRRPRHVTAAGHLVRPHHHRLPEAGLLERPAGYPAGEGRPAAGEAPPRPITRIPPSNACKVTRTTRAPERPAGRDASLPRPPLSVRPSIADAGRRPYQGRLPGPQRARVDLSDGAGTATLSTWPAGPTCMVARTARTLNRRPPAGGRPRRSAHVGGPPGKSRPPEPRGEMCLPPRISHAPVSGGFCGATAHWQEIFSEVRFLYGQRKKWVPSKSNPPTRPSPAHGLLPGRSAT